MAVAGVVEVEEEAFALSFFEGAFRGEVIAVRADLKIDEAVLRADVFLLIQGAERLEGFGLDRDFS